MPLTPFPITPPAAPPLIDDDFTAWASNGWVASGDAILIDDWQSDPDQMELFSQHLGSWGNNPNNPQDPWSRSTRQTKTYSGLPVNRLVIVTVQVAFFSQDFGAAGKFVGMWLNGAQFAPNVGASGTFPGNLGQIVGTGMTDENGEIEVAFGTENINPSLDLHIIFDDLTVTTPTSELADIFYDAGVLYISGNAFSITRGGIQFDPQEVWEEYDYPGKCGALAGLEELVSSRPVLRTTFMLTGEYQFMVYRPDGTWGPHATMAGGRTFTPAALRSPLSSGVYVENVVAVWRRARQDYVAVEFPLAIVKRYGMAGRDKDEGEIAVEIEARIPIALETDSASAGTFVSRSPAYLIHTYPVGTESIG